MKKTILSFAGAMLPVALCAILIPSAVRAAGPAPHVLTIREFIDGAVLHTPEIFRELARIRESESVEIQAGAVNDIIFDLHYNRLHDRPFTQYGSSRILEKDTDNVGTGLSWISPWTGTRIRGGVEFNRSALLVNQSPLTPNLINAILYNPEAYLEVQQPLLKNWLGIIDRFPVRQAELNRLIMKQTVDESIESIIVDLYNLYFSWYLAWHQQDIYSRNVKNGEDLVATVANKFANGLSDIGDVARARIVAIEYAKARDMAAVRLGYLSQKVYRWCYNKPAPSADPGLIPADALELPARVPEHFSIYNTRQMKILNLSRELLLKTLERDRSELLPELTAMFSYRARNYTLERGEAFASLPYPNYAAGATLTYPLQNSLGEGRLEQTRAMLKRWDHDLKAFERNYAQSVDELRETARTYEGVIRQDDELIAQAGVQLAADERKYFQGQSDLYFVIQDRNALLNYELVRITDQVDSRRVLVQLLGLMDEIRKD